MPFNQESDIKRGIENLINMPSDIDLEQFANIKEKKGEYGLTNTNKTLDKSKLCAHLVERGRTGEDENVFEGLRQVLEKIREAVYSLS